MLVFMVQLSCKVMSALELLARISCDKCTRVTSDLQAHAILLAVSMRSLVGLESRWSCLTTMPSSLCGSPNYQSSFVERYYDNDDSFECMIKVSGTPPNFGRSTLAHVVPSPCSKCYIIMAKGLIYLDE